MINIYKKREKSLENPSGYVEIKNEDIKGPFLLCISAQDFLDKSVFGIVREGAHAARCYTSQEYAGGFKIDKCPIDFLGLKFRPDDKYQYNYEEIVEKFLWPYLIKNGLDLESIKQTAKNMNFMTYCDGTFTYAKIENMIERKLKELYFSAEDIDDILSNFSLVSVGSMVNVTNFKTTVVSFVDVNDSEIFSEHTDEYKDLLAKYNRKSLYGKNGKNSILYLYEGSGKHSLKEYLKDETVVKSALSSVVSYFLEKSISDDKVKNALTIDEVINRLNVYSNEEENISNLINRLDKEISYNNTPRYTSEEFILRTELDASYKELSKSRNIINSIKNELDGKNNKVNNLIININELCDAETAKAILLAAGLSQYVRRSDAVPSLEEFQEEYDKSEVRRAM